MVNQNKEAQTKLMKGLLDFIVLQLLRMHPMHGYNIIGQVRDDFGVSFRPSTIYPLLGELEERNLITSKWDMTGDRPKKVYTLTKEGRNLLNFTENSFNVICKKIANQKADLAQIAFQKTNEARH